MKIFAALTAIGFAILAFAAVWLGGLNQDEGWYLYAAQLVSDGHVPYRDFFYTQGPVLPLVYSAFAWVWRAGGLLGARVLTLAIGAAGILFAAALAQRLVSGRARAAAALLVCVLLGGNLYHLYYLAIPKTYALAGLFAVVGFYLLSFRRGAFAFLAGLSLAFAAGTRISLGALLPVAGVALLLAKERRLDWLWFGLGGGLGLTLVYGPFLLDPGARAGLLAAQGYHAARGGFDPVFTVGSLSRLVRWYAPVFVLFGLALARGRGRCPRRDVWPVLIGFLAVFAVQMAAPFPYEDYQVPVMSLLTVAAVAFLLNAPGATAAKRRLTVLLALGMTWAGSFGSPLLEKWMTNGQDRFWTVKKTSCEMAQLRAVAEEIDAIDPGGKTLLTQDLYLAIETRRSVPLPLAMGPFSYWGERPPAGAAARTVLDTTGMRALLASAPSPVAAMSGYAFAVTAPDCRRTPFDRQMAFWKILEQKYELVFREEAFGQNATPLLVLKRRQADGGRGDNAK